MVSIEENALKFVFLAKNNPELNVDAIISMFNLPQMDMFSAIWMAEDYGYVAVNKETRKIEILSLPEFSFGQEIVGLMKLILYGIGKNCEKTETDLDDMNFAHWLSGYPSHDILIAMISLESQGLLSSYKIIDKDKEFGRSEYTFYTLPAYLERKWGTKSFKNVSQLEIK